MGGSGTEIMASSLGNLSFSAELGYGQAVVTDLTVACSPLVRDEVVETDGSNLGDYTIGDISVGNTNDIGIPGASLFAGDNAFYALGAIGDISLIGGGSPAAQTPLFSDDIG